MAISEQVLDEILKDCQRVEDLFGENGVFAELKQRLIARARSNGHSQAMLVTEDDKSLTDVDSPWAHTEHDIAERFRETVLSLYARGRSLTAIQQHIGEFHHVELDCEPIQRLLDRVWNEFHVWQDRPLDAVYPILYLDTHVGHVRVQSQSRRVVVQSILGVTVDGRRDLLGFWRASDEVGHSWCLPLEEIKRRGVKDVIVACVDDVDVARAQIQSTFSGAIVQTCLVRLLRSALRLADWRDRKQIGLDLRRVYSAENVESAEIAFDDVVERWDHRYRALADVWQAQWPEFIRLFEFPDEIRATLRGVGVVELLHSSLAKFDESGHAFANDRELLQRFFVGYLALSKKWVACVPEWKPAIHQFVRCYPNRLLIV